MNNAAFGKTLENVRKRRVIDLMRDPSRIEKYASLPSFKSITWFNDELVAIERTKTKVYLIKPIYTGLVVLNLSKLLMYDFWYNVLKVIFPNCELLFTDTDSFCLSIPKTEEEVHFIIKNAIIDEEIKCVDLFDFSDFPEEHKMYSLKNQKVLGKMKDEMKGNHLLEFIGIKSKAYALKILKKYDKKTKQKLDLNILDEIKKLKGIQTAEVEKNITFDSYKQTLSEERTLYATNIRFQSDKHRVSTIHQVKVGLTPYDDKRYMKADGITTLPYGFEI